MGHFQNPTGHFWPAGMGLDGPAVGDALWDCRRSFFFSTMILSGPYLWNRYSQRLQIECAAWSCGLVVHYCLPSNSLRYFFFILFFFCQDFVRAISLEPLLAETPNWVCCLVLRSNFALLLTIQFASLFFLFIFFFSATILSGPYLWNRCSQRLKIECAAWSCGLILHCCLPSNSLRYWTKVRGSLLGRIQGDREPVSFLLWSQGKPYHRHLLYAFKDNCWTAEM